LAKFSTFAPVRAAVETRHFVKPLLRYLQAGQRSAIGKRKRQSVADNLAKSEKMSNFVLNIEICERIKI
jgi:hypothetical protein